MTQPSDNRLPLYWLLVPSFLFGPETWLPVAETLRARGFEVGVADPQRPRVGEGPYVERWVDDIIEDLITDVYGRVVVVGHSASCPRLPLVAQRLLDMGFQVEGIVLVNGRFPANDRAPVDEDEPLAAMLDGLIRPDDYLPPWHRWWGSLVVDMLPDEAARERVFQEAHCVPRDLFDETIPAPELPPEVGRGYLTMGEMYRPSHDRAIGEGWVVGEVDGEHLHMVVDPEGVSTALQDLVGQFDLAVN